MKLLLLLLLYFCCCCISVAAVFLLLLYFCCCCISVTAVLLLLLYFCCSAFQKHVRLLYENFVYKHIENILFHINGISKYRIASHRIVWHCFKSFAHLGNINLLSTIFSRQKFHFKTATF